MKKDYKQINNIAFEGGGVRGIAHGGAWSVFEDIGISSQITNVAGTSAGSIVALLVALQYTASEIKDILFNLDFSKFEEDGSYLRILTKYGYYKTNFALSFIEGLISKKFGDTKITFEDLKNNNNPNLYVFSTSLTTNSVYEFSFDKTPSILLSTAVLASMSIPFFFEASNIDGNIYVDGGLTFNYSILFFNSSDPDFEKTIGFAFAESTDTPEEIVSKDPLKYDHLVKYLKRFWHSVENAQSAAWYEDLQIKKNTIIIETNGIKSTDFTLSDEQKLLLYNNGISAAKSYLE